jgi:predicted nucleic acid-binding protein
MFLLDTNVISELRRPTKANPRVAGWADTIRRPDLFLSVVTIIEIEIGILMREHRRDHAQAAILRTWMDSYIQPVDTAVALRSARLHVPDRRSDRDALIAATALVHGLTVVTRNISDFRSMASPCSTLGKHDGTPMFLCVITC